MLTANAELDSASCVDVKKLFSAPNDDASCSDIKEMRWRSKRDRDLGGISSPIGQNEVTSHIY